MYTESVPSIPRPSSRVAVSSNCVVPDSNVPAVTKSGTLKNAIKSTRARGFHARKILERVREGKKLDYKTPLTYSFLLSQKGLRTHISFLKELLIPKDGSEVIRAYGNERLIR